MKDILTEIIRVKIQNLKRVIIEFQRYIYKIKNERIPEAIKTEMWQKTDEYISPFTKLLERYNRKLQNMKLTDEKGRRIFKHWKAVASNLFVESLEDRVINIADNVKLINAEEINKYDPNGILLLYYIVSEIDKLIQFNINKQIKTNLVMFIMDFVDTMFTTFNLDGLMGIEDIKRFQYIINTQGYVYDIEQKGHGLEDLTEGIYDEYKDPDEVETEEQKEAEEDAIEENEALDVDLEGDDIMEYYPDIDDVEFAPLVHIAG